MTVGRGGRRRPRRRGIVLPHRRRLRPSNPGSLLDVVASPPAPCSPRSGTRSCQGEGRQPPSTQQKGLRNRYQLEPTALAAIGDETVHITRTLPRSRTRTPSSTGHPSPHVPVVRGLHHRLDWSRRGPASVGSGSGTHPSQLPGSFELGPGPTSDSGTASPREPLDAAVDGRSRWFEAPDATLETFCRYSRRRHRIGCRSLARTERSCGPPESLGTVPLRPVRR